MSKPNAICGAFSASKNDEFFAVLGSFEFCPGAMNNLFQVCYRPVIVLQ